MKLKAETTCFDIIFTEDSQNFSKSRKNFLALLIIEQTKEKQIALIFIDF